MGEIVSKIPIFSSSMEIEEMFKFLSLMLEIYVRLSLFRIILNLANFPWEKTDFYWSKNLTRQTATLYFV